MNARRPTTKLTRLALADTSFDCQTAAPSHETCRADNSRRSAPTATHATAWAPSWRICTRQIDTEAIATVVSASIEGAVIEAVSTTCGLDCMAGEGVIRVARFAMSGRRCRIGTRRVDYG